MSSPKRSNFLAGTTLRFQLSWTRWRLRAAKRRLKREEQLFSLRQELRQVEEKLAHPMLQVPQRFPEPEYLVTPVVNDLPKVELLTPGRPEPLEEAEPEEEQLPPEVEIAQRLGLPVRQT